LQILTPRGLRDPADMDCGDEVLSRDAVTGRLICNRLETRPQWVDRREFARWWNWRPPAFRFFRINGQFVFSRSQSIWANGNTTHVALLKVGDVIYTERNGFVRIWKIEDVFRPGWWRFDIDGDHTYILDGALVHNANRFWVGGTGDMDGSTTTHIASTSGGAGGASYPGSSDTLTLNGNSSGGTVTITADHTLQSLSTSGFTGTLDNAANDRNMTVTTNGVALNFTGSGAGTINMGDATWTISGVAAAVMLGISSTTTFNANGSTINFTGTGQAVRSIQFGSKTFNNMSFSGAGNYEFSDSGTPSIGTLTMGAGSNFFTATGANQISITTLASSATLSSPASIQSSTPGTTSTINGNGAFTVDNMAFKDTTFSGGNTRTANNSFNLGNNSGITINAPSAGGSSSARVIGG
jgi:hypothetical protein